MSHFDYVRKRINQNNHRLELERKRKEEEKKQNQRQEKDYKTPENLFRYSPLMKKNNPYFKK